MNLQEQNINSPEGSDTSSTIELTYYSTLAQRGLDYCDSDQDFEYESRIFSFLDDFDTGSESWFDVDNPEQVVRLPRLGVNKRIKKEYTIVRGKTKLRKGRYVETVSEEAAISMADVLVSMTQKLLSISQKRAVVDLEKERIEPVDIIYALNFYDKDLLKLYPEVELEYMRFLQYDREDDISDSINLIAENILEDKFTNTFVRFCSGSILFNGSISCRYTRICICPQDCQSSSEYIDLEEPETVIPVSPIEKKKLKKNLFTGSYHKLKNKKFPKKTRPEKNISPDAVIYFKAVLEHLTEDILELAGHILISMQQDIRIEPKHLSHAFISDRGVGSLYPMKNFSANASIYLSGVLKLMVREVLEWAGLFAHRFRRTRIEPIDLLFAIDYDTAMEEMFPSQKFLQARPNYTEIIRFRCNQTEYCCKRLVRNTEVVPDVLGCSGMQMNKLPMWKNEIPERFVWSSSGVRKKTMMQRKWIKRKISRKAKPDAAICWMAVTEFIATEVIKKAGDTAINAYWRRIEPRDLFHAFKSTNELRYFYPPSKLAEWAKNKFG